MGDLINSRRAETDVRLSRIQEHLTDASKVAAGTACVYATGSFGRGEASKFSDLDLFIVGRSDEQGRRLLGKLDEICIKADLVEATRRFGIPDFSGDGEYLVHYTVAELVGALGTSRDDASNTFTARLLLLLESRPLIGSDVYWQAIDEVIAAYWRDFEDHKSEFMPAFLTNDVLRLWRTFCVNYEANTRTEPAEKKAKRRLKNYKLKHSRLLTCYSGLVYLLAVFTSRKTVTPQDVREMIRMKPIERLEWLLKQPAFESAAQNIHKLIARYEQFLEKSELGEEVLIQQFLDRETSREYFIEANEFGNSVYDLLQLIGRDALFYRLLVV
ncbi:MAG: nucleotidyltransferase domain-containing protein [Candidatus Binatia bacterium]